jgi:hypothetical protein
MTYVCNFFSLIKGRTELRVSENRVLGSVFGPKKDEVPGDWRKFDNEVLHDLYILFG